MQTICKLNTRKVSDTVRKRVAIAINESSLGKDDIAKELDVSWDTIHRWSKEGKTDYKKSELKKLSNTLRVSYEWLQFGSGAKSDDPDINEIERRVAEKGESYKGFDQTLSNVESKANSLKQDLEDLLDEIDRLRGDD